MLKQYLCTREYKVDDGKWKTLSTRIDLMEEDGSDYHPRFLEETALTFDEVWESAGTFVGIYASLTFFRNRRVLRIHDEFYVDKKCNKISFRDRRREGWTTLSYLMSHLPSDIVMRYIKENGLAVCPLQ